MHTHVRSNTPTRTHTRAHARTHTVPSCTYQHRFPLVEKAAPSLYLLEYVVPVALVHVAVFPLCGPDAACAPITCSSQQSSVK